MEIDTVLLGDLIFDNLITAWASPPGQHDWYPVGRSATIVKGKVYDVPHWLCGYFIFSRDESIANSGTITGAEDIFTSSPVELRFIIKWSLSEYPKVALTSP